MLTRVSTMENLMAKVIKAKHPVTITRHTGDRGAVLEHVEATLASALEELRAAWAPQPEPPAPPKMPRGTGDVTDAAAAAAAQPAPTVRERVEAQLRRSSMDVRELARAIGASVNEVTGVIRQALKDGLVANVGMAEHPVFTWRIGDSTSAAELTETVLRLISERPMSTRDLTAATGARFTRVGGAIVAIQRSGRQILDLGSGRAGLWFVVSEHARDARLEHKR